MPSLQLSGAQLEELTNALLAAFEPNSLRRCLKYRLNKELDQLASTSIPTTQIVFEVFTAAEREGWSYEFVREAVRYCPGNSELASVAEKLRIEVAPEPISDRSKTVKRSPLHRIIDLLTMYHCALQRVHQADTREARLTSLDEWSSCHAAVWENSSVRDDTIRKLADPAKTWLSLINCRYVQVEDFNLVEEGAHILSGFAVSPSPISMPKVYSKAYNTEGELWQKWNTQGDQYLALGGLIARLKELAARAGQMWEPA